MDLYPSKLPEWAQPLLSLAVLLVGVFGAAFGYYRKGPSQSQSGQHLELKAIGNTYADRDALIQIAEALKGVESAIRESNRLLQEKAEEEEIDVRLQLALVKLAEKKKDGG